ncbi:MAG: right-handed parallel beta-helix repeat-containing protein [Candidatus Sumerlaeota bacterium]|nr:right-handed parallel beta-helix repeat-containing protein [Candidatus Sumerlaeota bacterium]
MFGINRGDIKITGSLPVILLMGLFPLLCSSFSAAAEKDADFFIAPPPQGDDRNPGTKEKPFATLMRARDAVRAKKAAQAAQAGKPVVIELRGGNYFINEALLLEPQDSGSAQAPIIWRAAQGEFPVISGGVALRGFQAGADGRWRLRIPEVEQGKWQFSQLFVNGQRRLRPRVPKEGVFFIARDPTPKPGDTKPSHDRLHFNSDDLKAGWRNLEDIEAVIFNVWTISRKRIQTIEPENHLAILTAPDAITGAAWNGLHRKRRYILENVAEALSEPGQWYLDRKTGELTYIPMPGEKIESAEVIAPQLECLMRLEGDVAKKQWVDYVRFENLSFAHTECLVPRRGYDCAQAEAVLNGAIRAQGARHCAWVECAIQHVGAYAIELGAGCLDDRIENCDITDLGAGGLQIGAKFGGIFGASAVTKLPKTDEVVGGGHIVLNNTIAHGGRVYPAAIGVWIGNCPNNRIANNDIYDFFYSGLSVGWEWGYGKSYAHHNIIEYNHVYNIGQRVLSDMGAIYTLGISPGTEIRGNCFHDVDSFDYGGWGIYFDEGSTSATARDNLVYRVKDGTFHQHYGKENIVTNNIFAFSRLAQVKRSRAEEHRSFVFTNNIVYWKEGDLLGGNLSGSVSNYLFDSNLYWKQGGGTFTFVKKTFDEWKRGGQDTRSIIADPGFKDPEKADFTLPQDTPARKVGFVPFDPGKAGRKTPSRYAAAAGAAPPARPDSPFLRLRSEQEPPALTLSNGFEDTPVGGKLEGFALYEENDKAVIRVTDEVVASGRRSLKFADMPGQKFNFNPHTYCDPRYKDGTAISSFKVRMEEGAEFFHEWRTEGEPYKVGPSLSILPSGALRVSGKEMLRAPKQTWIQIDIRCGLGAKAKGEYDATVTLPGQAPARFAGIKCDPQFTSLRWFGFCAMGKDARVFYLDDLSLRLE